MAYLRPPWFTVRVFNKVAMLTGIAGAETLIVTTRSGQDQRIPVISVDLDGSRFLVSTRGESQWVRNLRANPVLTLATKGASKKFIAREIPVEDRPPVLRAYRAKAGKTVGGYFAELPAAADHPVFALTAA